MSAHDDYDDGFRTLETHMQMCDEIDRLRAVRAKIMALYGSNEDDGDQWEAGYNEAIDHALALFNETGAE